VIVGNDAPALKLAVADPDLGKELALFVDAVVRNLEALEPVQAQRDLYLRAGGGCRVGGESCQDEDHRGDHDGNDHASGSLGAGMGMRRIHQQCSLRANGR
jgi:hypothetical protein